MSLKTLLAALFHPLERLIDKIKGQPDGGLEIDAYAGYATPEGVILRGRVLAVRPKPQHDPTHSKLRNAINFARLFFTDELAGLDIRLKDSDLRGTTDGEGYFSLLVPTEIWQHRASLTLLARDTAQEITVFAPAPDAPFAVISDIDDTMMRTGAYSVVLNLWTSITGNPLTRHIFDDAVSLMRHYREAQCPIFYVSSSPWNMHRYLLKVFRRHDLPLGPMFLRDFGLSEGTLSTHSHGAHKTRAIETLLAANPDLQFVLIGDTGQHDAEIYGEIARRYPGRICRIVLRQPQERLKPRTRSAISALRTGDVPFDVVPSFDGLT